MPQRRLQMSPHEPSDASTTARSDSTQCALQEQRRMPVGTIVCVCCVCAVSDLNFSLLVSFFPFVAERHGCSSTVTGLIVGVHQVVALLITPFAPRVCRRVGGALVLTAGIALQAALAVSFAFTDRATTTITFILWSAVLRAAQGGVAALTEVAGVGLLMRQVPEDRLGDAIGWCEAARGFGIMVGPLIGGGLDQSIGYEMPFFCSGGVLALLAFIMAMNPLSIELVVSEGDPAMMRLQRMPIILATLLMFYIVMFAAVWLEPVIAPFLAQAPYSLDEVQIGLVYSSSIFTYSAFSACAGAMARRLGNLTAVVLGCIIVAFSFFAYAPLAGPFSVLSPMSFLAQESRTGAVSLAIGSALVMGFGWSLAFAPANGLMVRQAQLGGLSVDQSSDAIAALSMVAFTAGAASGPLAAGGMVEACGNGAIGFQRGVVVCGYMVLVVAVLLLLTSVIVEQRRRGRAPRLSVVAIGGQLIDALDVLLENATESNEECDSCAQPAYMPRARPRARGRSW